MRSNQSESSTMPHTQEPCQLIAPQHTLETRMDPGSERLDWLDDEEHHGQGWLGFHDSVVSNDATVRHTNTVLATIGTATTVLSRGSKLVLELPFEENPRPSQRDLNYSTSSSTASSTDRSLTIRTTESARERPAESLSSTEYLNSSQVGTYVTSLGNESRLISGTSSHIPSNTSERSTTGESQQESSILSQSFAAISPDLATTSYTSQQSLSASLPIYQMGYPSTSQTSHWGAHDASNKMDTIQPQPLDSPVAEGKSLDGEDLLMESIVNSAHSRGGAYNSPIVLPLSTIDGVGTEGTTAMTSIGTGTHGTPSTVSTAPSTDDASLGGEPLPFDRLTLRMDDTPSATLFPRPRPSRSGRNTPTTSHESSSSIHRRAQSWEAGIEPHLSQPPLHPEQSIVDKMPPALSMHSFPESGPYSLVHPSPISSPSFPPQAAPNAWAAPMGGIQHIATFRKDPPGDPYSGQRFPHSQIPHNDAWRQQRHIGDNAHTPFRHPQQQQQHQQLPQHHQQQHGLHTDQKASGQMQGSFASYPVPRKPNWPSPVPPPYAPKPAYSTPVPPPHTPPRARNPRVSSTLSPHRASQAPNPTLVHSPGGHGTANPNRSSSEILKTLLRKKACLYEPDTSRAVALVTWLVGRELALEFGYFSRQQLQSGVHACVASKIDTGAITRTKVNRCMQIILNSCFHYIIPRPDGTEECGDIFRQRFGTVAADDSELLNILPAPWNNLHLDKEVILAACSKDDDSVDRKRSCLSPGSSPPLSSIPHEASSPGKDTDMDGDSKRAVLLCFNENVRSAEDVFRCHNEFIRDTANAAKLHLTTQEWLTFFGKEAATAPHLWGNIGIPVVNPSATGSRNQDVIGRMSENDLNKFRTTWCSKRYDHDREQCGFAHVDVNGGWLRRNPSIYSYKDDLCPCITTAVDKRIAPQLFVLNSCPDGVHCKLAHSQEEIDYHPNRYKSKTCPSLLQRGVCPVSNICSHSHPSLDVTQTKKPSDSRHSQAQRHGRQGHASTGAGKVPATPPMGAPMLYVTPAPDSSFDQMLGMPGLQNLFRRHCSVLRAHIGSSDRPRCFYSPFGDDWGIEDGSATKAKSTSSPFESGFSK